jgi:opacity protein-like surface antigen
MWHNSASNLKRGNGMLKRAGIAIAITFFLVMLLTAAALGQDGRFDASINGGAGFTTTATGNSVVQGATVGMEIFGTIRYKFRPKHSLLFNYGRTRDSQTYQTSGNDFHVLTSISEVTGAYMYSPFTEGKWRPFVLAGGGALIFSPGDTWVFFPDLPNNVPNRVQASLNTESQTQLAFLYGLGIDYQVPRYSKFSVRLQYRGFLYKSPDFKVDQNSGSQVNFFTGGRQHMADPAIGIVYRF